jgi:hypothetical protein
MRSIGTYLTVVLVVFCSVRTLATPADSLAAESPHARPVKSTSTAITYSLLLPGLGQIYTENYWKAPLFAGVAATSAVLFFRNNASFIDAATAYNTAVAGGENASTIDLLLRRREAFRDNRDLSGVVFLITYALAAVDAYVGAELYTFDTGEKLSLSAGPTPSTLVAVNLRLTW